jgi:hypothetical protein
VTLDVAFLFPPLWYFAAVPADLSLAMGAARGSGLTAAAWDLSAGGTHELFGDLAGWKTMRSTGLTFDTARSAGAVLYRRARRISARIDARHTVRQLTYPDVDEGDVRALLGLCSTDRNPYFRVIRRGLDEALAREPRAVGVALVHPDQRLGAIALLQLLRWRGYRGTVFLFGNLEDVFCVADLGATPEHALLQLADALVVGDLGPALPGLVVGDFSAPNLVHRRGVTRRIASPPAAWPDPDFSFARAACHPFAAPIVDLRLGRGCSWGVCAFCGIAPHQAGYRADSVTRVVDSMNRATQQLGTTRFRLRDDLLRPDQLAALGKLAPSGVQWTARARFTADLDERQLTLAMAGGLSELWLGLESAVPRVRTAMKKGVPQRTVDRVLALTGRLGLRVRLLCMVGFPGETLAEAGATIDFLLVHQAILAGASLSCFQVTPGSPIRQRPEAFGIALAPDPVPVNMRLRARVPFERLEGPNQAAFDALYADGLCRLGPWMAEQTGPWPETAWTVATSS